MTREEIIDYIDSKKLAYTDMPLNEFGDKYGKPSPTRECKIIDYDDNKYCEVVVYDDKSEFSTTAIVKTGYIYKTVSTNTKEK